MLARQLRNLRLLQQCVDGATKKGDSCWKVCHGSGQAVPGALSESAAAIPACRSFYSVPSRQQYAHFKRKPFWEGREGRQRVILIGVGAAGTLFYITHLQEVPYTHRKHAIFVSPQTEIALGLQTFQQVKEQAQAEGKLLPQRHPMVRAVEKVGMRIAHVAGDGHGGGYQEHMKNLKWEFAVIDEPGTPNAFVVPGGKVVVFTGLLNLLQMHDDEMAAVLGHEVAHVLARHVGEKLSSAALISMLQIIVYFLLGIAIPSEVYQLALFLPNSRKQETEADAIGVMLAARACFDPKAAIIVFTKLGKKEKEMLHGARVPQFMLTHPLSEARVKAITKNLPKAEQEFELSGCTVPRDFWSPFS